MQNAIKYSPKNCTITVECCLKQNSDKQNYMVTRISDQGKGFDTNKKLKKFQTFQLAGSKQNDSDGVGIGLSTAQSLTEFLGGELTVNSSDQGTQVQFSVFVTEVDDLTEFR